MSEIPTNKSNRLISVVLVLVIVCAVGVLVYTNLPPNNTTPTPSGGTNETRVPIMTIRYNTEEKNYTLQEIEAMPSYTGKGGYRTSFPAIRGVGNYTGITIHTLLNQFSDLPNNYSLNVTSNYQGKIENKTFNYSMILGNVDIYNPQNASDQNPIGNNGLTMVLAYKFEGNYLNESADGKLKIVFLDDIGSITSAGLWWKSVVSIYVITE